MYIIIYKGLYIHIFAECLLWGWWPWGLWPYGVHGCRPPTILTRKWDSKCIIDMLHLWLNSIIMHFFNTYLKLVYIIIGRHAYHDARALHGQLVKYVLKHFIRRCLLYIKVTERHTMNFI